MSNKTSLALHITLALGASAEEVRDAIGQINRVFNLNNDADAAPAGAITPEAVATTQSGLDKDGFPWDERIHSSSKNFNNDGTWRLRKGVDKAVVAKVQAELRGTLAAAPAAAVAAPVAAPAIPALPTMPLAPINTAFNEFVQFVAANTQSAENPSGRLTPTWMQQFLAYHGIANGDMQNLAHVPDKIAGIFAALKQALGVA